METSKEKIDLGQVDHFAAELDDFAQCILEKRPSKVSGEEGLKDLLAIEAIYRSIDQRKTIAVDKV